MILTEEHFLPETGLTDFVIEFVELRQDEINDILPNQMFFAPIHTAATWWGRSSSDPRKFRILSDNLPEVAKFVNDIAEQKSWDLLSIKETGIIAILNGPSFRTLQISFLKVTPEFFFEIPF